METYELDVLASTKNVKMAQIQIFRPSAAKPSRPYGVLCVSSSLVGRKDPLGGPSQREDRGQPRGGFSHPARGGLAFHCHVMEGVLGLYAESAYTCWLREQSFLMWSCTCRRCPCGRSSLPVWTWAGPLTAAHWHELLCGRAVFALTKRTCFQQNFIFLGVLLSDVRGFPEDVVTEYVEGSEYMDMAPTGGSARASSQVTPITKTTDEAYIDMSPGTPHGSTRAAD